MEITIEAYLNRDGRLGFVPAMLSSSLVLVFIIYLVIVQSE